MEQGKGRVKSWGEEQRKKVELENKEEKEKTEIQVLVSAEHQMELDE